MADEKPLRIAFVGAGAIHFGGAEMPWDHASRLERIGGVQIVAVIDPLVEKAASVVKTRQQGEYGHMYNECRALPSAAEYLGSGERPDAVLIGVPPAYHGSTEHGKDVELMFLQAGIPAFIEKPLSVLPPGEFSRYAEMMKNAAAKTGVSSSVGYMFR